MLHLSQLALPLGAVSRCDVFVLLVFLLAAGDVVLSPLSAVYTLVSCLGGRLCSNISIETAPLASTSSHGNNVSLLHVSVLASPSSPLSIKVAT